MVCETRLSETRLNIEYMREIHTLVCVLLMMTCQKRFQFPQAVNHSFGK